jgi:hypothetical protein
MGVPATRPSACAVATPSGGITNAQATASDVTRINHRRIARVRCEPPLIQLERRERIGTYTRTPTSQNPADRGSQVLGPSTALGGDEQLDRARPHVASDGKRGNGSVS